MATSAAGGFMERLTPRERTYILVLVLVFFVMGTLVLLYMRGGALRKTEAGPVTYDARVCLGCRYCMVACPFDVPRYEYSAALPSVRKCDMCVGRAAEGKPPACAEVCPAEATVSGTRAGARWARTPPCSSHRWLSRPGDRRSAC